MFTSRNKCFHGREHVNIYSLTLKILIMSNIWKENQGVSNHPNRNNFDLSYQNHLSMKLGTLYPIMCKPVVPGDSFEINTAFGLKFMPMIFPIQSKMMTYVHYFYVRNKNLWKNWENFISGLEEHVHPYISQPASFFATGSISDYLGVPTTIMRAGGAKATTGRANNNYVGVLHDRSSITAEGGSRFSSYLTAIPMTGLPIKGDTLGELYDYYYSSGQTYTAGMYIYDSPLAQLPSGEYSAFEFETLSDLSSLTAQPVKLCFLKYKKTPARNFNVQYRGTGDGNTSDNSLNVSLTPEDGVWANMVVAESISGTLNYKAVNRLEFIPDTSSVYEDAVDHIATSQSTEDWKYCLAISFEYTYSGGALTSKFPLPQAFQTKNQPIGFSGNFFYNTKTDLIEDNGDVFASNADGGIHVNALPYRAYESVYNAYYRNWQNQPFYVNGNPVYNQYNTTLEDGADTTDYQLFQRNYELDYLTSCMPSPQFGNAPLVGVNAIAGDIELEDESYVHYTADLDNNGAISRLAFTSADGEVVATADIPKLGMTINDFRGANALQHFLEMTLRHGYKYQDFIEGHFGSKPKDQELDMPEFIGGVSEQVIVNQITNMAKTSTNALGELGGTANCFGMSKNKVRHYCDDYGYIIGIMCVVPEPAYSQLLPKHFLNNSQLDYFFPEFSQLGLQPITYKEVCPVQRYYDEENLSDTFGYQRPNYDMVSSINEVHGQFRQSLHNFLFNRQFASSPELGSDFLTINPKELNDVFVYEKSSEDTIIGQVILDIKAKRPVPRVNIPGLGR